MNPRPRPAPRPKKPPAPALLLALCLALCLAAAWWWLWTRPGPAHERAGLAALAAGQTAEAERQWRAGAREDAGALDCYAHLGDLYLAQRRFPEAEAAYAAAARLAPSDGTLFLRLTRAALAAGDLKGAEAASKRAADLRPGDADAAGLYGLLEVKRDDRAAALPALRRAHALRPGDRDYLLALVNLEVQGAAFAQAGQDLAPYLRANPGDAWACHLMAVTYELKSHDPADWRAALAFEQRAQAGLPGDPRVYITLGDLYLSLGRPAESRKAFQAGQRLLPNSEAMLHGLVQADGRLGDRARAASDAGALQRVATRHQQITFLQEQMTLQGQTALNPAGLDSALVLARLEEEEGDDGAAQRLLTGALSRAPHDPRLLKALSDLDRRHALRLTTRPRPPIIEGQ